MKRTGPIQKEHELSWTSKWLIMNENTMTYTAKLHGLHWKWFINTEKQNGLYWENHIMESKAYFCTYSSVSKLKHIEVHTVVWVK